MDLNKLLLKKDTNENSDSEINEIQTLNPNPTPPDNSNITPIYLPPPIPETYGKQFKERIDFLTLVVAAVIIVLFIGFAAIFAGYGTTFITNHNNEQATLQNLEDQIQAQNTQIQVLTNQLKNSTVVTK
jgi:uncharacterized membrane protein